MPDEKIIQREWDSKQWKLMGELGRGANGMVYRAVSSGDTEEVCAIKEVSAFENYDGNAEKVKAYQRIATKIEETIEAVQRMPHPHIVKYEEVFQLPYDTKDPSKGFRLYIRMEKLTSLEEYMQSHPMNAREVTRLGAEICSALEACEERRIIHRDIKPSNILVTQTGDYKLTDFGAAHIPKEARSIYMAPEVDARKKDYDATVDAYSLGLTLYHLLYHLKDKQFFKTDELDQRFNGKPLPPLESIDQPLSDIINTACAYEAKNRYPSPKYMREDLQNYLKGKPIFQWKSSLQEKKDKSSPQVSSKTPTPTPQLKWPAIVIPIIVLLIAAGCWFAFFQRAHTVDVTEIRLNSHSLEMEIGDEPFQLSATVLPENATNRDVTWSSDNLGVASVSESDGLVTAIGEGDATITAKSGDCTATCAVTVIPPSDTPVPPPEPNKEIPPQEVILTPTSLEMKIGDEPFQLSATVLPENATNRDVTWSSDKPDVASVSNGLVTAKKDGTAVITAKSGDCTATCTVTISPKPPEVIKVKEVRVNPTSHKMTVGDKPFQLSATVLPENATNRDVTWSSDNPGVASVSNGLVTAKGKGTATITARSGDCTATCTVTVAPIEVTEVRVNPTSLGMTVGDEPFQLSATVLPENATNRDVTWSSDNPGVASVSNGLVTAKGKGTATITAKSGAHQATCNVTVSPVPPKVIEVTEVRLNRNSAEMTSGGETLRLSATVLPENATNRTVTWNSSNTAVVTVDQEGVITAIDTGDATVAASCGGKSASCKISVITPVERVSIANISDNWLEINRGSQKTLTANIFPSNATDSKITWNSDNPGVATVSAEGVLSGVEKGRAVITASAGGQSDSFTVAVVVPVTGVTLNSSSIEIANGGKYTLTATVTPSDANDPHVTWTTTNSSVARVSNGTVTGAGDGEATITAQAGEIKAHCKVQVTTLWSDWSDQYPNVSVTKQQRTVYQYIEKRKETTTSSSPSLDGYARTGSTEEIGDWSTWTDSVIYPSDSLQVETQQVTDVEGHTEYRYGRWLGATVNWCKEYAESLHGGVYTEQYTNWSTIRAYACEDSPDKLWTCGNIPFDKEHTAHRIHPPYGLTTEGKPGWRKYIVNDQGFSGAEFFWEETRWVDTTYKTQYRSRPVSVIYSYERWVESSRSEWTTDWREVDNISSERQEKTQYRYMIT